MKVMSCTVYHRINTSSMYVGFCTLKVRFWVKDKKLFKKEKYFAKIKGNF